jgi:glycosyltransferase involved in cell wall biosynthesis
MTTGHDMASNGAIRVLKVLPTLHCGGTEHQVTTLTRALADDGFDLEVGCMHRAGPLVNALTERDIPLREYPISSFLTSRAVRQQVRLARHIVVRRTHIVHAYGFYGNVFAIPPAAAVGVPVIIASVRDRGVYLTSPQTRAQRYICHLADRILVNADAVKAWLLEQGYPPKKIVVIRNGVDVNRFDARTDSNQIRQQLGLGADERMVTVVSRITRLKGLEQFIDAASLLAPWFPTVRFVIAGEASEGDSDYVAALKRRAEHLGHRVLFIGHRFDVPALLKSAAVAVMPSLNEALSNVLLESMAAGAPIVATRVGGTPEAIVHGDTGLLVRANESKALSGAIARLLNEPNLAVALGRAARRTAESSFSLSRMVAATERLYQDLLAQKVDVTRALSYPTRS